MIHGLYDSDNFKKIDTKQMPEVFHILNGDCLADQLLSTSIQDNIIVFRECLIEGPLEGDKLSDFWQNRAQFISQTYDLLPCEYEKNTVVEFNKIDLIPDQSEVCLWFEHDLFCQVNIWFIISILAERKKIKLFRVSPSTADSPEIWNGFGNATTESLEQSYVQRVELEPKDIALGCHFWMAYKAHKLDQLKELSYQKSKCFSYLEEVCQAHIDRFGDTSTLSRPDRVVKEIIQDGHINFESVMTEFSKREGIYGLGDLQLKKIYDKQIVKTLN